MLPSKIGAELPRVVAGFESRALCRYEVSPRRLGEKLARDHPQQVRHISRRRALRSPQAAQVRPTLLT